MALLVLEEGEITAGDTIPHNVVASESTNVIETVSLRYFDRDNHAITGHWSTIHFVIYSLDSSTLAESSVIRHASTSSSN